MAENKNNNGKAPSQPANPAPTRDRVGGGFANDSKKDIRGGNVITSTRPAPKPPVTGK